jgi:protein phosphatase 1 regulatory subunit 36
MRYKEYDARRLAATKVNASALAGGLKESPQIGGIDSSYITINDVKNVALDLVEADASKEGLPVSSSFREVIATNHFDNFLITLLRYFKCFFASIHQQNNSKSKFLQPSKAELKAVIETEQQLLETKRQVGQAYCALILGIGLEATHHMGCGSLRVSSTHQDKRMFENVYLFCVMFIWVSFKRQEFDRVRSEVGDMLRSKPFNPTNKKPLVFKKTQVDGDFNPKRSSTNIVRKDRSEKRPAIMTVIHQRSTALSSLLPLPKEKSKYLFQPFASNNIKKNQSATNQQELLSFDSLLKQHELENNEVVGIIGEPMDLFNIDDLTPKNTESDDDDSKRENGSIAMPGTITPNNRRNVSRHSGISRITTEDEKEP